LVIFMITKEQGDNFITYSMGVSKSRGLDVVMSNPFVNRIALSDGIGNGVDTEELENSMLDALHLSRNPIHYGSHPYFGSDHFDPDRNNFAVAEWEQGYLSFAARDTIVLGWKESEKGDLELDILSMPPPMSKHPHIESEVGLQDYIYFALISDGGYGMLGSDVFYSGHKSGLVSTLSYGSYNEEEGPLFLENLAKGLTGVLANDYKEGINIASPESYIRQHLDEYFSKDRKIVDDISIAVSQNPDLIIPKLKNSNFEKPKSENILYKFFGKI